jgi:RNA polymerase sigma factor (sigma-70 family)
VRLSSVLAAASPRCPRLNRCRWFSENIQPYEPALRTCLLKRFPTLPDHDDLVQETFVRALRAHEREPVPCARAFLLTTARNAAIDLFRRRRSRPHEELSEATALPLLDEPAASAQTVEQEQRHEILVEAILALPERCQSRPRGQVSTSNSRQFHATPRAIPKLPARPRSPRIPTSARLRRDPLSHFQRHQHRRSPSPPQRPLPLRRQPRRQHSRRIRHRRKDRAAHPPRKRVHPRKNPAPLRPRPHRHLAPRRKPRLKHRRRRPRRPQIRPPHALRPPRRGPCPRQCRLRPGALIDSSWSVSPRPEVRFDINPRLLGDLHPQSGVKRLGAGLGLLCGGSPRELSPHGDLFHLLSPIRPFLQHLLLDL